MPIKKSLLLVSLSISISSIAKEEEKTKRQKEHKTLNDRLVVIENRLSKLEQEVDLLTTVSKKPIAPAIPEIDEDYVVIEPCKKCKKR